MTQTPFMMDVVAKIVRIMWVPVLLAVFYTGWVFWQRRTAEPGLGGVQRDPLAAYGNSVKILQFYTNTGTREIAPGEKAVVCYGVVNAAAVRIDPPIEKMWPAVSRCFDVTPTRTTRYILTAESAQHVTVSQSIDIAVKR